MIKGKRAVMDEWGDIILTVFIGFFMCIMLLFIFKSPAKIEAAMATQDINYLSSYHNLNQFLKTPVAENNGKSVAETIVEAYGADDGKLRSIISKYADLIFNRCYPEWEVLVFNKEYKDNFAENLLEATFTFGECSVYAPFNFYVVDLPTPNPDEPIFVVFAECLHKRKQTC